MSAPAPRTVTPLIAKIRDFMSGRKIVLHTRHETKQTPRTIPPAKLPTGVSHNMSGNYYYTRDGRRLSEPSTVVVNQTVKRLALGQGQTPVTKGAPRPGQVYNWDS